MKTMVLRGGHRHRGARERDRRTGVSQAHTVRPAHLGNGL